MLTVSKKNNMIKKLFFEVEKLAIDFKYFINNKLYAQLSIKELIIILLALDKDLPLLLMALAEYIDFVETVMNFNLYNFLPVLPWLNFSCSPLKNSHRACMDKEQPRERTYLFLYLPCLQSFLHIHSHPSLTPKYFLQSILFLHRLIFTILQFLLCGNH